MNEEVREQMLNVMFGTSSSSEDAPLNESEESLEEGLGTAAAKLGNNIKADFNSFKRGLKPAVTAAQQARKQADINAIKADAANKNAQLDQALATKKASKQVAKNLASDIGNAQKAAVNQYKVVFNTYSDNKKGDAAFANAGKDLNGLVLAIEAAYASLAIFCSGQGDAEDLNTMKKGAKQNNKKAKAQNKQIAKDAKKAVMDAGNAKAQADQAQTTQANASLGESVRLASLVYGALPSLREAAEDGFAKQGIINIYSNYLVYNKAPQDPTVQENLRQAILSAATNFVGGNTNYLEKLNKAVSSADGKTVLFRNVKTLFDVLKGIVADKGQNSLAKYFNSTEANQQAQQNQAQQNQNQVAEIGKTGDAKVDAQIDALAKNLNGQQMQALVAALQKAQA